MMEYDYMDEQELENGLIREMERALIRERLLAKEKPSLMMVSTLVAAVVMLVGLVAASYMSLL